jgi:hypothetical protein
MSNGVKIAEREQSLGWLNMLARWIRSGQFDDDAALNVIDRAKNGVGDLLDELSDAEKQIQKLQYALRYLYRHADERLTEEELKIAEDALDSTEPKEKEK